MLSRLYKEEMIHENAKRLCSDSRKGAIAFKVVEKYDFETKTICSKTRFFPAYAVFAACSQTLYTTIFRKKEQCMSFTSRSCLLNPTQNICHAIYMRCAPLKSKIESLKNEE